MDKLCRIQD
ncbi:hypothetical protein S40293_11434 [Stachybotrys chartarum IBT 40293]|nr:hypothetical protein S40293_11434 [Stachybotrys chartarum IBT 40293]